MAVRNGGKFKKVEIIGKNKKVKIGTKVEKLLGRNGKKKENIAIFSL